MMSEQPLSERQYLIPAVTGTVRGQVQLPGSKSIALRQLAISALTKGTTVIRGIPQCDDAEAMLECLQTLGAKIERAATEVSVTGPIDYERDVSLNARMSGASTRLLLGIAALRRGATHIDGHASLRARTNQPLLDVLAGCGCEVSSDQGCLPVTVRGPMAAPDVLPIDGSLSSQYITALLIAAPALQSPGANAPLRVVITGELVSRPYIDITLNEMRKRGIQADWTDEQTLIVQPGHYKTGEVTVEGDATAASYFAALATLHGGDITLTNLGSSSCQGDYQFIAIMEQLGARAEREAHQTRIIGPARPNALPDIDMTAMPDTALTLIPMAALLPASGTISGLSSLHHKECDRLECPADELRKMGIEVDTTYDSIRVAPTPTTDIQPHLLSTYHDHRMAMAFSLIGSVTGSLTVDDVRVVDKTYPAYWDDYNRILAG